MADATATPLFGVPVNQTVVPAGAAKAVPAPQSLKYEEKDGKHKGIAGVGRDILGTLGDFLLTKLGMPAMYGPAQKQRKLNAAFEGFDQDPLGAINRVSGVDQGIGLKLRDQFIDNQRAAASLEATQEARDARLAQAKTAQDDRTRGRVASMFNTMTDWTDDKRTSGYGMLREQALKYAKAQGLDMGAELPEAYDPFAVDSFIDASVPVGTQRQQRLTDERNKIIAEQGDQRIGVAEKRVAVTEKGQSIRSADTRRGQDIRSRDTRRGQDVTYATRSASTAERARSNKVRESRFTPDPNKVYIQNGIRYKYVNGTYKAIK